MLRHRAPSFVHSPSVTYTAEEEEEEEEEEEGKDDDDAIGMNTLTTCNSWKELRLKPPVPKAQVFSHPRGQICAAELPINGL